jgi:hypothetical protein
VGFSYHHHFLFARQAKNTVDFLGNIFISLSKNLYLADNEAPLLGEKSERHPVHRNSERTRPLGTLSLQLYLIQCQQTTDKTRFGERIKSGRPAGSTIRDKVIHRPSRQEKSKESCCM